MYFSLNFSVVCWSLWSLVFDFVTPVCISLRPTDSTENKREIHTGVTKSKTSDHRDQQTTLKLREKYIQELQSQKQVTIETNRQH
jgi:hypothetical protein